MDLIRTIALLIAAVVLFSGCASMSESIEIDDRQCVQLEDVKGVQEGIYCRVKDGQRSEQR